MSEWEMKSVIMFEEKRYYEIPFRLDMQIPNYSVRVDDATVFVNDIQLSSDKLIKIADKHFCIFNSKDKAVLERSRVVRIEVDGDLHLLHTVFKAYIVEMRLIVFSNVDVYINGSLSSKSDLSEGDIVQVASFRMIVYKNYLEVYTNRRNYKSKLIEVEEMHSKFEEFPKFNRPARIQKKQFTSVIEVLSPPAEATLARKGVVLSFIPTLLMSLISVIVGVMRGQGIFLIVSIAGAIISFVSGIAKYISDTNENNQTNELRQEVYEEYMMSKRKEIYQAYNHNVSLLHYEKPSPIMIQLMLLNYSYRLYERSNEDEDFLTLCLGTHVCNTAFEVAYDYDELELKPDTLALETKEFIEGFKSVYDVPKSIDLKSAHMGLVGHIEDRIKQVQSYLLELCYFHSYQDLEIIVIGDESYFDSLSYAIWFPHLHLKKMNGTGLICNSYTRDLVLTSVYQELKERELNGKHSRGDVHYLFIIVEVCLIHDHPMMEYLQKKKNDLGYSIIYCASNQSQLPENIETIVQVNSSSKIQLLMENGEYEDKAILARNIESVDLELCARLLANIEHVSGMSNEIPNTIGFLELFDAVSVSELDVKNRWRNNEAYVSLATPIGYRSKTDKVSLDLHEKAHGPHGLVAGTTGSGKSEIIQTYILSLAVNFSPHHVGFLLIDYKGGGMANLFRKLPHLLGTITNLDGHESMRALVSVKSELKRRQRVFDDYGVNNINSYHKLMKTNDDMEAIPHLFIISDEFAELKKEQPEFMKELVSTARIGRSLGVHLILATQKPTGVVDEQIWSNSKFKLCLKVQDETDSKEILKTGDAAMITQPGRAYLQVGNNEVYELFQSAYSGGIYTFGKEDLEVEHNVYRLNELRQRVLLNPLKSKFVMSDSYPSELEVIIDELDSVYQSISVSSVRKPWLHPLPKAIVNPYTSRLLVEENGQLDLRISIGLLDIPEEQTQKDYVQDLQQDGHLIYIASSLYGKTMFLSNIILNLCSKNSTDHLNVYVLDFGSGALNVFQTLSQVGDYISLVDDDKLQRFIYMIEDEITLRRKQIMSAATQNFTVHNQISSEKMKAIVVCIDQFEMIKEKGMDIESSFTKLLREGLSLGIYFIFTVSRSADVKGATMNQIKNKIVGYTFDASEAYQHVGRSKWSLSDIKGRAFVKLDEAHIVQLYLPIQYDDEAQYIQKMKREIETINCKNQGKKAIGVRVLPHELYYNQFSSYEIEKEEEFYLGLHVENVKVVGSKLVDEPYLVIGNQRSGKTSVIKLILQQLHGIVHVCDTKKQEFASCDSECIRSYASLESYKLLFDKILHCIELRKTKYELEKKKSTNLQLDVFIKRCETFTVIIHDLEYLDELSKQIEDSYKILEQAMAWGIRFVVGIDTSKVSTLSKGWSLFKHSTQGIIVGNPGSFNILDLRMSQTYRQGFGYVSSLDGVKEVMLANLD